MVVMLIFPFINEALFSFLLSNASTSSSVKPAIEVTKHQIQVFSTNVPGSSHTNESTNSLRLILGLKCLPNRLIAFDLFFVVFVHTHYQIDHHCLQINRNKEFEYSSLS